LRLYLTIALAWPAVASAGGEVSTRVDVYDDGWMHVVVPAASATVSSEDLTVSAGYAVDMLTGATQAIPSDTLTSATWYTERRHQFNGSFESHPDKTWGLGAFGFWSREPDYRVASGGVSGRAELFDRMSTVTGRYGYSNELVRRHDVPAPVEGRSSHQVDLSWTQIVSRRATLSFLATAGLVRCGPTLGCAANPYRFVALRLDETRVVAVPEHNPAALERLALAVRGSIAVDASTAVRGGYRLYADTWRVVGHTLDLSVAHLLINDHLSVEAVGRGSAQSAAAFYQDVYALDGPADAGVTGVSIPYFRTADRELAGLESLRLGGRVGWTFDNVGPFLTVEVAGRAFRTFYRYPKFSDLPRRNMWLAGVGLEASL